MIDQTLIIKTLVDKHLQVGVKVQNIFLNLFQSNLNRYKTLI